VQAGVQKCLAVEVGYDDSDQWGLQVLLNQVV
jgi:hypothetical protein